MTIRRPIRPAKTIPLARRRCHDSHLQLGPPCAAPPGDRVTRTAFTLVELLVVIAIIGILCAAMLPALSASRQAARRLQCSNNLMKVALALGDYEQAFQSFPAGTVDGQGPILNQPSGMHHSWLTRILPYMDRPSAYRQLDFSQSVYSAANRPVREIHISEYLCPADPNRTDLPMSSYAGCHNDQEAAIDTTNNGVLFLNSAISRRDLTDGLSQTIMVGERIWEPHDLGWVSGTRATLRNAGTSLASGESPQSGDANDGPLDALPTYVGGFGSHHLSMVNFVFADGSVQSLGRETSLPLLQQLANRADSQPLSWP